MSQEYDYLRAGDAVSGQEGWATMVVDGVLTELFMIKDCTMTFTNARKNFVLLVFVGRNINLLAGLVKVNLLFTMFLLYFVNLCVNTLKQVKIYISLLLSRIMTQLPQSENRCLHSITAILMKGSWRN